jgi:hypothetical protein
MSWHHAARAQQDAIRRAMHDPEVKCWVCGYHYRAKTGQMRVTDEGWQCHNLTRCATNRAQQAHYRGDAA